jgi:glycosyltransferase involved in cell wall biosynthesis
MCINSPSVTVLMPAYNAGRFIREAIESVLAQTHSNFEFIIINDGSTDNTEDVIRSFSDPRIRVISQENKGIADALNLGLAAAKAPLIARFDADDICYPNRLEIQYKLFEQNPSLTITGSGADYIDQHNHPVFTWFPMALTHARISKMYRQSCPFIHSGVMFRKKEVIRSGGYNGHAHSFEDHLLWVKLLDNGGIALNISEPLLQVRLNPESVTIDEKWRSRQFRKIKYNSLQKAQVTEEEGSALKKMLEEQNRHTIKSGAYHALLAKKYLWNNYQPVKARESIKHAIRIRPFRAAGYGLLFLTYLSQSIISRLYKIIKFHQSV